jgi:CBS-domain-containing membrane protein
MKARDIMTSDHIWACNEATPAREAAQMMVEHNVGSLPVVDNQGRLSGIVTDRDLCCRVLASGMDSQTPVSHVMSKPVHMVHPDSELREIERIIGEYRIRRLPVVDEDGRLQGFIAMADLARKVHGLFQERHLAEVLGVVSQP